MSADLFSVYALAGAPIDLALEYHSSATVPKPAINYASWIEVYLVFEN